MAKKSKESKKDIMLQRLEDLSNQYEENDLITELEDEYDIEILGPNEITESGFAYHVGISVPKNEKWMDALKGSWGVSYKGTKPDIETRGDKIFFFLPVPISSVGSYILEELVENDADPNKIPYAEWATIEEGEIYKNAAYETARILAAGNMEAAVRKLKLDETCDQDDC